MSKYKNPSGHNFGVYLKDWFEAGFRATSLYLTEELGDHIASGTINLEVTGKKEDTEIQNKLLYSPDGMLYLYRNNTSGVYEGIEYEIPIFITEVVRERSDVSISFICCKEGKKFYNDKLNDDYETLLDAVNGLYKGKIDQRTDPDDFVNSVKVHLNHETPYIALRKLLYSYKKDTIFSFGLEGLLIRSVKPEEDINSWGTTDTKTFVIGTDFHLMSPHRSEYNKGMYEDSFNPWEYSEDGKESEGRPDVDYTDLQYKNLRVTIKNQLYSIVGYDHYVKHENYVRNSRYTTYGSYKDVIEVIGNTMPSTKIGDIVKVEIVNPNKDKKEDHPFDIYMVASNEIGISYEGGNRKSRIQNRPCWWKMKLICLQDFVNSDNQEEMTTSTQNISEGD